MRQRSIGDNIRKWRKARRLTQQELADKVGLTRQQINRIETGREGTTMERLDQIAEVLNVSRIALLDDASFGTAASDGDAKHIAEQVLGRLPPDVRAWLEGANLASWLVFAARADQRGLTPSQVEQAVKLFQTAKEYLSGEKTDNPK